MQDQINIPGAPKIAGLSFRHFRGASDFPAMVELFNTCKVEDQLEWSICVEDIARDFRYMENCDPKTDILIAEVDGKMIAYGRLHWEDLSEGIRLFHPRGYLHPEWRGKGLGSFMLAAAEERARQLTEQAPAELPKVIQDHPFRTEKALIGLLEKSGYQAVRYETHMLRDLSEPFPEAPMPSGLEVRPVRPEHLHPIFEASNEAFQDHWGIRDESEQEYLRQLEDPDFRPELWKVAWDGDQIASVIHNFYIAKENEEYARKRGYTEGICTRRPWRKMGLARALLVQSMQMFKEMGMTETALSVDAENISGATRLYEGVGYHQVRQQVIYRKPLL